MKLLLAEDERSLSKALVTILEHNNYTVEAVYDGQTALDYLLEEKYDAAILDIMMPKRDGISVLKAARERGLATPVLLLTAKTQVDDRVVGLDAGADDYLTKPFAAKELLARIRAITRRREVLPQCTLAYSNIILSPADSQLSVGEKSVRLANREYQMMELLLANPGILISTERFMERIWGYDADAEINVVWTYISRLRRKLSDLGAAASIKAARGTGYALEEVARHD